MDKEMILLGAMGLIGAAIGIACTVGFKKRGRRGHLMAALAAWFLISTPGIISYLRGSSDLKQACYWLIGNVVTVSLASLPLWFLRKDVSNKVLFGITIPIAFFVGWLYIGIVWLTACFLFGVCDP